LGFADNIASTSDPSVGTKNAKCVWLPGVPKWTPHGDDAGDDNIATIVSSIRQTISPLGHVKTLGGGTIRYSQIEGIRWEGVANNKTKRRYESTAWESFEQFWLDSQVGALSYSGPGAAITFFWDADASDSMVFKLVGLNSFDPARFVENWIGRYIVQLPRMIVVPS
jgi:hypothetical protein